MPNPGQGSGSATPRAETRVTTKAEAYQGPIPSPEMLRRYEEILPGAAERILRMAEDQAAHRRRIEAVVIPGNAANERRGQFMAFVLAVLFGTLSFILVLEGHDAAGGILGTTAVLGLTSSFLAGRRARDRDLGRKNAKL